MIKKLLISISILMLFSVSAFSKTLIKREYIPYENICFIEINLNNEDLLIQKYTGEDILVEIYSNNINICPLISSKDGTLSIESCKYNYSSPIYCRIEIFVPVNFIPETISISNISGNAELKLLKAKDYFKFSTQSGKVTFDSIFCDSFNIQSVSSDINYQNLKCNYFYISTISGNIDISLIDSAIQSKIQSTTGNIKFTYDKKSDLELLVYSEKPLIRNQASYKTKLTYNPQTDDFFQRNIYAITLDTKKGSVEIIAK